MGSTEDYADFASFKKLVDDVGLGRAVDVIRDLLPPDNGNFSKERRTLYTCSNEATAAIMRELEGRGGRGQRARKDRVLTDTIRVHLRNATLSFRKSSPLLPLGRDRPKGLVHDWQGYRLCRG